MLVRPRDLHVAAGVRELDRVAIEDFGIDGYELMCRAGASAFRLLRLRWPAARSLTVLCGPGNNGGDGLVVGRLALAAGLEVRVCLTGKPEKYRGAAARAWSEFVAAGGEACLCSLNTGLSASADVIVDGLLGTGLDRPVRDDVAAVIETANAAAAPVLALDVPSGIHADSGGILGTAVRADATISFIGAKRGLFTGPGLLHAGAHWLDDLDVPVAVGMAVEPAARWLTAESARALLPVRSPFAHKGTSGQALVVGGDHGMAGAVRMAAEAALRTGSGLVRVATRPAHAATMAAARPELMVFGVAEPETELSEALAAASVVIVGPGLGRGDWGRAALLAVLRAGLPCVIDADGLNLLAESGERSGANSIITPHPGEAGRLLGCATGDIEADRFATVDDLRERYEAVPVLKGPGTIIGHDTGRYTVCGQPNPALATGGTGDVLAGTIGGLLAQGVTAADAAVAGACLHARAGELAAAGRTRGLLAGELLPLLAHLSGQTMR